MIEAPWCKYDRKPRNFTLQIDEGILKEHCRAPKMTPRWVFFVNGPLVSKPSFPTFLGKLLGWFPQTEVFRFIDGFPRSLENSHPKKIETQSGFFRWRTEVHRLLRESKRNVRAAQVLGVRRTEFLGGWGCSTWFRILCCAQSDPKFVPSMDLCPKWS